MRKQHDQGCGQYCPYPDTEWVAPGGSLPKCRGGDCTLCDEVECTCVAGGNYEPTVVGQCTDCGADVYYSDDTFYPWTVSTTIASTKHDDGSPHRLHNTLADAAWDYFYQQTGRQPRHDVTTRRGVSR